MKMRQAFKFELRPSGEQVHLMHQFAGCRRYVYNRALALQQARREAGEKRPATLSDGSTIAPLNRFRQLETTLARAQRALARKVRFSNTWKKQKARTSKIHRRIAHARNDFLHKASTTISQNHAIVVIEDLEPGTNVRAKAGLNKAILDQGWGHFRRMLEYKVAWRGGKLLAVLPAYTSQDCSACGHRAQENRTSQARFQCVVCGHTAHADLNAARNILAAGHAVLACGAEVLAAAVKQEPAEATAQEFAHA
jgi:putative transposase